MINGYLSYAMRQIVVNDPFMYHKGEMAQLYIEILTRIF